MTVALWGVPGDGPLDAVAEELEALGESYLLIDQRQVLATSIVFSVGSRASGTLRLGDREIRLDAIDAWYIRPMDIATVSPLRQRGWSDEAALRRAASIVDAVAAWTEVTPTLVVNRLSRMAPNGSKPLQLRLIHDLGFRTPRTLVTTDPEAVREFWERHGEVVYKSVSAIRSRVSRLTDAHRSRLAQVCTCPTQFQEWIGGIDVRVHVVGDEVFATEVASDADDYRYPGSRPPARLHDVTLDAGLAQRCREIVRAMGLHVAGIDFRRGTDGDWYCFEVNPSPAFTAFERGAGRRVSEAVARLLVGNRQRAR